MFCKKQKSEWKLSNFKFYVRTHQLSAWARAATMRNHLFWLCIHFCHLPHHSYLNLVIIAVVGHKKKNLWTPRVSSYRLLSLTANDNHENLFWPSMYFWQSDCLQIASVCVRVLVCVATMRLRPKFPIQRMCFAWDIMAQRAHVISSSSFPVSAISFGTNNASARRDVRAIRYTVSKHMCLTAYSTQQDSRYLIYVGTLWRQKSGLYFPKPTLQKHSHFVAFRGTCIRRATTHNTLPHYSNIQKETPNHMQRAKCWFTFSHRWPVAV